MAIALAASAVIGLQLVTPAPARATVYYWDNNGTTAGFGTAAGTWANPTTGSATQGWSTSTTGVLVPGSVTTTTADALNFGNGATGLATGTIAVSGTVNALSLTYGTGTGVINLSGGTVNLATGITNGSTTNVQLFNTNLTLAASATWTLAAGATFNNAISGAVATRVDSTGVVTLNAANSSYAGVATTIGSVSYVQGFRLNTGTTEIATNSSLGTGAVDFRAALRASTALTGANKLTNTFVMANATGTLSGANNIELGGSLISSNGAATPTLAVTNTGTTTVSGTISLSDSATVAKGLTVDVASAAGATTISGTIQNFTTAGSGVASGLTKTNAGLLTLSGSNTYTGATTISAGTLQFAKTNSMTASGALATAGNATLAVNAGGTGEAAVAGTGAGTIAGLLAGTGLQGSTVTLATGSSLGIDTTNATGTLTLATAYTFTNNAGLLKLGAGTLALTNGGTFSGNGAGGFPLITRQGTLLLNGGTFTANGEAVVGGLFGTANGSAGYNAKLQVDSGALNITGYLSIGRGNGVGGVSSDLLLNNAATVTAANFSAGYSGGTATNLPKGSITLNNTSSLTIGDVVNLGESAGANMALTLNDSSVFAANGVNNNKYIGNAGTGTVTLNGTSSFSTGGDTFLGNVAGGVGRLVINGGTYRHANASLEKWFFVGQAGTGRVDVNSGNFYLQNNAKIRFSNGAGVGDVMNLGGGNVTFFSDNGTTVGGTGLLDMQYAGSATSNNTFNLDGGTLTVPQVLSTVATGTRTFNFNGGTIAPTATNAAFFNLGSGSARANVRDGGAKFDTRGFDATVATALVHSNVSGNNPATGTPDAALDGGLTKSNSGTLILTGTNTYTGPTVINGGTVAFRSAQSTLGSITVTDGAALTTQAVVAGTTVSATSLTVGTSGTTTLTFDFSGLNTTVAFIAAGGTFTANGTVNVSLLNGSALAAGAHTLVSYGAFAGGGTFPAGPFTLGNRSNGTLANGGGLLVLNVTADNPIWTGLDSGVWKVGSTGVSANWKVSTGQTDYIEGDTVLFDDTATGSTAVTIATAVTPNGVTFANNVLAYGLGGAAGIGGSGGLTKTGSAALVVTNANTYTGVTTIGPGATLTLGDGTSGHDGTLAGTSGVADSGTLAFNRAANNTAGFVISGTGSVTVTGAGTQVLSGANTYSGGTTVTNGTLAVATNANLGAAAGAVLLDNATLIATAGFTNSHPVTVGANGATINIAAAAGQQFYFNTADTLRGSGALTLTGNGTLVANAGNLRIDQANSYAGVATVRGGGIFEYGAAGAVAAGASFVLDNQGELTLQGSPAVSMPNGVTVVGGTNSVLSFENGNLGTYAGAITLNANAIVGLRDWYNYATVRGGTISGAIGGSGGLTVNSGTGTGGTLTLSGSNTYAGGTTVSGAIVAINADAALGSVPASPTTNLTFATSGGLTATAAAVTLDANRNISVAGGATATFNAGGASNVLTVNGSISNTTNAAAAIALASNTSAAPSGTVVLAGSNNFVAGSTVSVGGGTNVSGGVVRLANSNALGLNAVTINNTFTNNAGIARVELAGGITLGSNVSLTLSGHSNSDTVADREQLRNVSGDNTFNGAITITAGGGNYAISNAAANTLLTLGGTIRNDVVTSTRAIALIGPGNGLISGTVTDGSVADRKTGIAMAGGGTWRLTGLNAYTGGTTVAGGTLRADNGTSSFGTGATAVSSTGVVAGNGNTGGSVAVGTTTPGAGGTITAGTGATGGDQIGALASTGQTWNTSGKAVVKVNGNVAGVGTAAGAGTAYDTQSMTGLLSLASLSSANRFTLSVVTLAGSTFVPGSYKIASAAGITPPTSINGGATITTAGTLLTDLFVLNVGGTDLAATEYSVTAGMFGGGGAGELYLNYTPTPEPGTVALAGLAVAPLLGRRRRRVNAA